MTTVVTTLPRLAQAGLFLGLCLGMASAAPARAESGRASFYGAEMGHGRTASGAVWRPMGLSAAHRSLPLGCRLRVRLGRRSVVVVVNDRGPAAWSGRVLDLSRGAARVLGFERAGTAIVNFTRLN